MFFIAGTEWNQTHPTAVIQKETVYRTAYLEPTMTQTITKIQTVTAKVRSSNETIISNSTSPEP